MGVLKFLLPLCLLLAACAASSNYDPDFEPAPDEIKADWPLVKERCSQCHTLDRVFLQMELQGDKDDVEWMVEDMASRRGSNIKSNEVPRIVEVLDWHRTR